MTVWRCVGSPAVLPGADDDVIGDLIGRDEELDLLRRALAGHRLVTVTGRAGVGKSRLAAAAAGGASRQRVVGVRWQGRGPGEPGSLASAVSLALGGRHLPDPGDLVRRLAAPGTLLFLDDVDPVHQECTGLVQRLLVALPDLRVLVTSRQVLGLGEEHVLALRPLATSSPSGATRPAAAVELFLHRARAVGAGFPAGHTDVREVERICRSLEGVPHAVELAAEQLSRQSPHELAVALERQQCWLHSDRARLSRHRSLRDSVGASYLLCERATRIVWARASAFAGAFDESAAVFLCAGGSVEPEQVPSSLAQLVAMKVLEPVREPGGLHRPRYRFTRAAREFGAARLRAAGEWEPALERRTAHCRQVGKVAESLWAAGCQNQAALLVAEEQEELTALLHQAQDDADLAESAWDIVVSLWFWWVVHGRAGQARDRLVQLLSSVPADDETAAKGRWLAAWLVAEADPGTAADLLARSWPRAVLSGDDATAGHIAHVQGLLALYAGDPRAAAGHFAEAACLVPPGTPSGPSPAVSLAAQALCEAAFAHTAAARTAHRVLAHPDFRDDAWAVLTARYVQAYVDHCHGRGGRARSRARRALALLDSTVPEPLGAQALRVLVTDIDAGRPHEPRPTALLSCAAAAPGGTPVDSAPATTTGV
ncbi:hypothetical protein QJ054_17970 [Streptomyces sp. AN-3]|uniref:ATP-binding protein n=1 Tax=Streptomyces sp. AN-3 TaxID=3044177 RepID=UPI00249BD1AE|nr:hypothetical protein [Streptomyces sp. AN-3]MDI3098935.1 hypothetical protein [Streptomyces sp. AN-3]